MCDGDPIIFCLVCFDYYSARKRSVLPDLIRYSAWSMSNLKAKIYNVSKFTVLPD